MHSRSYSWDAPFVTNALASGDVNQVDPSGMTPLWHACYFNQPDKVAALLAAGARIDAHDTRRIERSAGDTHVVSIWRGIPDPGYPVPAGPSSLLHAAVARTGSAEVVLLLVAHGVPVDVRDIYGDTPLHVAAWSKAPLEVLIALLDRGADPNAIDRAGHSVLDHCFHDLERGSTALLTKRPVLRTVRGSAACGTTCSRGLRPHPWAGA
jgi:ankyrin repeat protein